MGYLYRLTPKVGRICLCDRYVGKDAVVYHERVDVKRKVNSSKYSSNDSIPHPSKKIGMKLLQEDK